MKKKIFITLLSLFAFVTLSFADTGYVYKGKVGKYPIELTMGAHGWLSYPMNITNNAYAGWI